MFPGSETKALPAQKAPEPPGNKILALTLVVVAVVLAALFIVLWLRYQSLSSNVVPTSIAQQAKSPIYIPKRLPGNYKVDKRSFAFADDASTLVFQARDSAGSSLSFSEQPKPKDLDYEEFYKTNFEHPKTLNNVPYPSVWDKTSQGRVTLSIVTDETWIMMVTGGPLDEEGLRLVGKSIERQ